MALVAVAINACQPSATPSASGGGATASKTILSIDELRAPDPALSLALTPEAGAAVAETVGVEGASLVTMGSDGTSYRLDIPPETLLFDTQITMTPLSDIAGFPFEAPEHRVGVMFEPDGLAFASPATLTITPKDPLPAGAVAVVEFEAGGVDAALATFTTMDGSAVLRLDHFSGASAFWPLHDEWWRIIARSKARDLVRQLQAAIAAEVGLARAQQLRGTDSDSILEIALHWAPIWDELILEPALERANAGCREAADAVLTYVIWERQLQLMGLRDPETGESDPRLARPIPDSLMILKRDLCFEEQFQRCRDTGDFKSLMAFFLAHFRQQDVLGLEVSQDDIDLALLYLERCGRWDLEVVTWQSLDSPNYSHLEEIAYHFKIAWRPGSAAYGLAYSAAMAEAEGEVVDFETGGAGCNSYSQSNFQVTKSGRAEIKQIDFAQFDDAPPQPQYLKIEVFLGSMSWDETAKCGLGSQTARAVTDSTSVAEAITGQVGSGLVIDRGWVFADDPFIAEIVKEGTIEALKARAELTLEHTPAP